jgi:hypothetical protein
MTAAVTALGASAPTLERHWTGPLLAAPNRVSPYESLLDLRPVSFTLTLNWQKVAVRSTMERLQHDPFLWRNMHFDDWDRVPGPLRADALQRMLGRYQTAFAGPDTWACLRATDWDTVPQPVRAVVFQDMVTHWARTYGLTRVYSLSPRLVVDTINAVMMAESWFDHRGLNVNEWGNRDIGLGGCSDRCRRVLAEMADAGDLDFHFEDEDYFNPWHSTRALVVWFGLELIRSEGDLERAVRAYHRGFTAANDSKGSVYLANVLRLRGRYFSSDISSPSWRALRAWAAQQRASTLRVTS